MVHLYQRLNTRDFTTMEDVTLPTNNGTNTNSFWMMEQRESVEELTYFETYYSSWLSEVATYAYYFLTAWILIANFMSLAAFIRNRKLQTKNNALVISLVSVDILTGLTPLLRTLTNTVTGGAMNFAICMVAMTMQLIPLWTSIFHLVSIAIERYVAIMHPLRYHVLITPRRLATMIATDWVLAVGMSVVAFAWPREAYRATCVSLRYYPRNYTVVFFVFPFWACVAILFLTYYRIYRVARKHEIQIASDIIYITASQPGGAQPKASKPSKLESKATHTLLLIYGVAMACYCPFLLATTLMVVIPRQPWVGVLYYLSLIGLYANSGMNFIIYVFKNRVFRQTLLDLLPCPRYGSVGAVEATTSTQTQTRTRTRTTGTEGRWGSPPSGPGAVSTLSRGTIQSPAR